MSYDLTTFRTVDFHNDYCKDCIKCRHPNISSLQQMLNELTKLRGKRVVLERKIRETSLDLAELERQVRILANQEREGFKAVLMNRITIQAGYLHMLLRYSVILKRDTIRVQYQIHRAHRPQGSYPHNNPQDNDIDDDLEVNMALGAPDLASLLVYDYYPGRIIEDGRDEADRDIFSDDGGEYSILPHLYAYLTSNMDDNDIV